ncbi:MAG: hypothetical protein Q7U98_14540 [Methylicorpusculum sp.]|nr:hypothetical protein [Methylicorpusculum sp.]MDO8940368.1 hypothetical protein [Methylicorpusculum sp.]MDP2204237.1 hypothetical protein [Methylicorpusculum sp.]
MLSAPQANHPIKPQKSEPTLFDEAVLAMTGRVTMLGISRWTEKGAVIGRYNVFLKQKITTRPLGI